MKNGRRARKDSHLPKQIMLRNANSGVQNTEVSNNPKWGTKKGQMRIKHFTKLPGCGGADSALRCGCCGSCACHQLHIPSASCLWHKPMYAKGQINYCLWNVIAKLFKIIVWVVYFFLFFLKKTQLFTRSWSFFERIKKQLGLTSWGSAKQRLQSCNCAH